LPRASCQFEARRGGAGPFSSRGPAPFSKDRIMLQPQWIFAFLGLAASTLAVRYSYRAVDHGEKSAEQTCFLLVAIAVLSMTGCFMTAPAHACESHAFEACGLSVSAPKQTQAEIYCHAKLDPLLDVATGATAGARKYAWINCLANFTRQPR
jgi:hypothetical protein